MIPDVLPAPERRCVPTKCDDPPPPPPRSSPPPVAIEESREEATTLTTPEETTPASGVVDDTTDEIVIEATTHKDMEQRMTLRQLRDTCTEMGLVASGKKSELVARVLEARGGRSNAG